MKMENMIYLACIKMDKISGGYDLDPCIDPTSPDEIKMIACNDLIALQLENKDALNALGMIGDVLIVPVSLGIYNELNAELNNLMENVDKKLDEAVTNMVQAYKIMNVEVDADEIREQMMESLTNFGSAGKVLNENLEIVERADNYVVYGEDDDYEDDDYEDDDYADDEDDEDYDEYYDDDEE